MEIPAAASKLKFSSYEIEKGLDNDIPVRKPDGAVAGAAPATAPLTVTNVFGS